MSGSSLQAAQVRTGITFRVKRTSLEPKARSQKPDAKMPKCWCVLQAVGLVGFFVAPVLTLITLPRHVLFQPVWTATYTFWAIASVFGASLANGSLAVDYPAAIKIMLQLE